MVRCWRGLDEPSLETLRNGASGFRSNLVAAGSSPYALAYDWQLDATGATASVELRLIHETERTVRIERGDQGWLVEGQRRPDLDGAEEVDLSATPFCNSIPLWRGLEELDTVYVKLPELLIVRSRQRYERLDDRRVRYVDLGAATGFTAVLELDDDGFVQSYEGLFVVLDC